MMLSPASPLKHSEYWQDLMTLLAEAFQQSTKEIGASAAEAIKHVDKAVADAKTDVQKWVLTDEEPYSNISRRLRTDMRVDRERFGRLRDDLR